MNDNQDNSNNIEKKPSTIIQIINGTGISTIAYILIILIGSVANNIVVLAITAFVILAFFAFLIVRFFRTGYKTTAITMLIFISPLLAFLFLFGACFLAFNPL
jgi:ABC-type multidrug transport system permease subunit